jgi:hypothetical protein
MATSCRREWTPSTIIDLTIKVTCEGVAGEDNARTITFHNHPFITNKELREGIRLYRLRLDGKWKESKCDDGFGTGFGIFDDPPIPVNIGNESDECADRFASLRAGESWNSLPDDVKVGVEFEYLGKGAVVSWWDWGTKEQHRDTVVKLPCWITGNVLE